MQSASDTPAALLAHAKAAYAARKYTEAVSACGSAVHRLLCALYSELISTLEPPEKRIAIIGEEAAIGLGRPYTRFTLGQLIELFRKADLFNVAAEALEIDLGAAAAIDFKSIVMLRNRAVHGPTRPDGRVVAEGAINATTAGFVIFQSATLLECLHLALEKRRDAIGVPAAISPDTGDSLAYLEIRVASLNTQTLADDPIQKAFREALQYARLNTEDALFKLRKILELMARDLYAQSGGQPGTRMLDQLITSLVERHVIPNRICKHMENIKRFGNAGAHPSGEAYGVQDVEAVFLSLLVVVEWYLETRTASSPSRGV